MTGWQRTRSSTSSPASSLPSSSPSSAASATTHSYDTKVPLSVLSPPSLPLPPRRPAIVASAAKEASDEIDLWSSIGASIKDVVVDLLDIAFTAALSPIHCRHPIHLSSGFSYCTAGADSPHATPEHPRTLTNPGMTSTSDTIIRHYLEKVWGNYLSVASKGGQSSTSQRVYWRLVVELGTLSSHLDLFSQISLFMLVISHIMQLHLLRSIRLLALIE